MYKPRKPSHTMPVIIKQNQVAMGMEIDLSESHGNHGNDNTKMPFHYRFPTKTPRQVKDPSEEQSTDIFYTGWSNSTDQFQHIIMHY